MNSLTALAERSEAECLFVLQDGTSPELKARLGIGTARIGGGVAMSVRNDPTGYWSKALGFGFDEPVDADVIGRVSAFYQEQQSPGAVLQIAPSVLPPDWDEICAANGLTAGGEWIKLAVKAEEFKPGTTSLRVGPVPADQIGDAISAYLEGFGMPAGELHEQLTACLENPEFLAFSAWDGDGIVATAIVRLQKDAAQFCGAATLPEYRGRGAQSALQALRADAAAEAGCQWIITETGVPAEGESNPSLNNMIRGGFQPLYRRRNWKWLPGNAS